LLMQSHYSENAFYAARSTQQMARHGLGGTDG
jgi:hypothetical protein